VVVDLGTGGGLYVLATDTEHADTLVIGVDANASGMAEALPAIPPFRELSASYACHGLTVVEARPATPADVAGSHSSWAKCLRATSARPVTLLRLRAR
jgi:hypothetical protein